MRTFTVIVEREGKQAVSYPARGCEPLSGDDAIRLMRTMKARGLHSIARTNANGITEDLTLTEMETAVGSKTASHSNSRQRRQMRRETAMSRPNATCPKCHRRCYERHIRGKPFLYDKQPTKPVDKAAAKSLGLAIESFEVHRCAATDSNNQKRGRQIMTTTATAFRTGQRVYWNDPEALCSGYGTITKINGEDDPDADEDTIVTLAMESGGEVEAVLHELSDAASNTTAAAQQRRLARSMVLGEVHYDAGHPVEVVGVSREKCQIVIDGQDFTVKQGDLIGGYTLRNDATAADTSDGTSATNSKATNRPWQIASAFSIDPTEIYGPPDPKGRDFPKIIAGTFGDDAEATANAALIVQAVNSFDAMRDALDQTARHLHSLVGQHSHSNTNFENCSNWLCVKNRAALAITDAT